MDIKFDFSVDVKCSKCGKEVSAYYNSKKEIIEVDECDSCVENITAEHDEKLQEKDSQIEDLEMQIEALKIQLTFNKINDKIPSH